MDYSDITQDDVDGLLSLANKLDEIVNSVARTTHPYDNRVYELCNLSSSIRSVATSLTYWFIDSKMV